MHSQGAPSANIEQSLTGLDPQALTVGFARRFATYKPGNLLFRNIERLKALFADSDRKLQILFASMAHPKDDAGRDLIRQIVHLARYLVQGCDVWLNKPRRPFEASAPPV